jgi:hypothetical protein
MLTVASIPSYLVSYNLRAQLKMPPKGKQKAGSSRLAVLPAVYPGKIGGKGLEAPQWGACKAMLEGVYIAKNGT